MLRIVIACNPLFSPSDVFDNSPALMARLHRSNSSDLLVEKESTWVRKGG